MDIKTTGNQRSRERGGAEESSKYLRRTGNKKLRKSTPWYRNLLRFFPLIAAASATILLAVLCYAFYDYVRTSDRFNLDRIRIQAGSNADKEKLVRVIRETFPPHLLKINLEDLRNRLEDETWVHRAEIRRILPSDLFVRIVELTPSGILEIQGELYVCDRDGRILDRYHTKYTDLDMPIFRGFRVQHVSEFEKDSRENIERVQLGFQLLNEIEAANDGWSRLLSEVDLSDVNNVKLFLVDELVEISIGDQYFSKRFQNLMDNMSRYREIKEQHGAVSSIDLRFEDQIIYRPVQASIRQVVDGKGWTP